MRRVLHLFTIFAVSASAVALVWFLLGVWSIQRDNSAIRSLAAGKDVVLHEDADPRALQARILYLAWRDRSDEALELLTKLGEAPANLRAEAAYAIGNARLRAGFERIELGELDKATPEITLAKSHYRDALQADPHFLSAKVNLSLAMRLVRDLPRDGMDGDDDPGAKPQKLWTDLPGLPRGAP